MQRKNYSGSTSCQLLSNQIQLLPYLPQEERELWSEPAVCSLCVSGLTKSWLCSRALYILSLFVGVLLSTSQEFQKENQLPRTLERVGDFPKSVWERREEEGCITYCV